MFHIGPFFMFIALVAPITLIVWFVFSWLGRIARVAEDIALTLHRIEQSAGRPQAQLMANVFSRLTASFGSSRASLC